MPNHWHLVVWPPTAGELSQFMHRLTWRHAADIRTRSNTVGDGHVYQGRYRAWIVDSPGRYLRVMQYVEANALRAGLVTRAQDWPWSSLRERAGKGIAELDVGPVPLPQTDEWLQIVNRGMSAADLEEVRGCR
jgi:putative transposase